MSEKPEIELANLLGALYAVLTRRALLFLGLLFDAVLFFWVMLSPDYTRLAASVIFGLLVFLLARYAQ